jgi:hypothetical protein
MMEAIHSSKTWFLQEPQGITSLKTAFFKQIILEMSTTHATLKCRYYLEITHYLNNGPLNCETKNNPVEETYPLVIKNGNIHEVSRG